MARLVLGQQDLVQLLAEAYAGDRSPRIGAIAAAISVTRIDGIFGTYTSPPSIIPKRVRTKSGLRQGDPEARHTLVGDRQLATPAWPTKIGTTEPRLPTTLP